LISKTEINIILIEKTRNYRLLGLAALAAVITFIVYLPALGNSFVNWDDPVYFSQNPNIRSLNMEFLKWALTAVVSNNWHPLTMLSHAVDYSIFGPGPFGPHLVNNLLHSINTALVAVLTFKLVRIRNDTEDNNYALLAAFVTATLFGTHPQHVESVAWISERKDLLSAFFYLLSLLAYLTFSLATYRRALYFVLAIVFTAIALLAKPMAVTIPLAFLILDFYPLEKTEKPGRALIEKIPFFLLAFIFVVITLKTQKEGAPFEITEAISNLPAIFSAYAFYIYKTVLPFGLSPLYPNPISLVFSLFKTVTAFGGAIIITIVVIKKYRDTKLIAGVWVWFIILLLPVIGIVPIGTHGAADRYTYLPTLGLLLIFALWASSLYYRSNLGGAKKISIVIIVAAIFLFSVLTINQVKVWKEPVSFWSQPIEKYSKHVPLAYINRAMAYEDISLYEDAVNDYSTSIRLRPKFAESYNNRGLLLNALKRYSEALNDFNSAIRYKKDFAYAYNNRGLAYLALNKPKLAIWDFKKAISIEPDLAEPFINLSSAYLKIGQKKLAAKAREKAKELEGGSNR
jgi:tetratricopeptide (TPR) repeat protein